MRRLFIVIIFLFMLFPFYTSFATSFIIESIPRQLSMADGVIHGVISSKVTKLVNNGNDIITVYSVNLKGSSGLSYNLVRDPHNFKFYAWGGEYMGRIQRVSGIPVYKINEEVVVILSKEKFGLTVYGDGLGKYNFKRIDGETFLVSSLFPKDIKIGQIRFRKFKKLLENQFSQSFVLYRDAKSYLNKGYKKLKDDKKRRPASIYDNPKEKQGVKNSTVSLGWLVILLGLIGALKTIMQRRKE